MNVAIRYYTRSGNTKKLADAISSVVNVPALTVDTPLDEKVDILFLGNSVYAAHADKKVVQFIKDNKDNIGTIVNFSTAALVSSTYNQIQKIAEENNVSLAVDEFHCKGSFGLVHKGRPNSSDIEDVKAFAKEILK